MIIRKEAGGHQVMQCVQVALYLANGASTQLGQFQLRSRALSMCRFPWVSFERKSAVINWLLSYKYIYLQNHSVLCHFGGMIVKSQIPSSPEMDKLLTLVNISINCKRYH